MAEQLALFPEAADRKPKPIETEGSYYCKNPRGPWYLRENHCKCSYKEP